MEENNFGGSLGNEFREVMTECKELIMAEVVGDSLSGLGGGSVAELVREFLLVGRLMNLCCDLFEKQDKLMDKMDKVMDKYLEN